VVVLVAVTSEGQVKAAVTAVATTGAEGGRVVAIADRKVHPKSILKS
jgi:hypothetical protein